jgi:transcriptional regulator with XRE-family HTH domain
LAREGLSFESIANKLRMSRRTLNEIRNREPEFDRDILAALSDWDIAMTNAVAAEPDPQMRKVLLDQQTRRFPHRYSIDPKWRVSHRHSEDDMNEEDRLSDVEKPQSAGDQLQAAINAMLDEREGPIE